MIWIEFAGLVGSGKSTLAGKIRHRLTSMGYCAYSPSEALEAALGRDPFAQAARRLPHGEGGYVRWLTVLTSLQFSFRHPRLIWHVYRSGETRGHLAADHQRKILRYFFKVAGWYWLLGAQLGNESYVIADEGFFHRAINLFAWSNQPLTSTRIERYFQHIPYVDLVVRVNAPVKVCLDRAVQRGLPVSLISRDTDTVMRFMENSDGILDAALLALKKRHISVGEVWNTRDVQEAEEQIFEMMHDSGLLTNGRSYDPRMAAVRH